MLVQMAAERAGTTVSTWARDTLRDAALEHLAQSDTEGTADTTEEKA